MGKKIDWSISAINGTFQNETDRETMKQLLELDSRSGGFIRDLVWYYNEQCRTEEVVTDWVEIARSRAEEWQEVADKLQMVAEQKEYWHKITTFKK